MPHDAAASDIAAESETASEPKTASGRPGLVGIAAGAAIGSAAIAAAVLFVSRANKRPVDDTTR